MTTLVAGPAGQFLESQLQKMVQIASDQLANVPPIRVRLGKIIYHPEAILLGITPDDDLAPLRNAAITATHAAGTTGSDEGEPWRPHVTLCYSTSDQPAGPIINALGTALPERTIDVSRPSLVIQNGSELVWDWTVVRSANTAAPARAR